MEAILNQFVGQDQNIDRDQNVGHDQNLEQDEILDLDQIAPEPIHSRHQAHFLNRHQK